MRKVMLGLLLATGTALPTLAAAQEAPVARDQAIEGGRYRGSGGARSHDIGPRAEQFRADQPRPQPAEARRPQPAAPPPQAQAQAQVQAQARVEARGEQGRWRGDGGAGLQASDRARFGGGDPRRFDGGNRQTPPGYRPDRAPFADPGRAAAPPPPRPDDRGFQGGPGGYRADAYGRGPAPQYRPAPGNPGQYRAGGNGWNRGWRGDQRYDWGRYRAQNRYAFRLPRYDAPRGWGYGYRRFSPGITLYAGLFDRGFWIDDPFYYRLPPAYGPYRWVRYYDDALLVDLRTGYVVDVVYDIFW